ncbi:glycosyltransferase family 4 protein [Pseudomonas mediterranea]|uniref:glycosyltransferase family 4 protein n=1 Tax=Pseudomonas mediterranea TaxID=183795 RepID=UPI000AE93731|nr:glycosyltransferase family 4 protein [Pseudomonas mediterranea]MDU9029251.1 glycosyltransferase family 4 protein [Pseudomonas mediterranea]
MNNRLLIIVNDPAFFISHRLAIAVGAKEKGYEVHIATMAGKAVRSIVDEGFFHHTLPLSRSGSNPFAELLSLFSIWRLLWHIKPGILHLVTIKPVIYGGIAARLAPVKGVVAAVSGLGFVFISKGAKAALLRRSVSFLYRLALGKKNLRVIFQNLDDCKALRDLGLVSSSKVEVIRGSGVDLDGYSFLPEQRTETPVVCLAARLLRDKGVLEFVDAAKILNHRGIKARFQLIGDIDPGNPATITFAEVSAWRNEGFIELLGYRKDIATLFAQANIVTLPSYREGLPKVLVEAAACGRAVVTTDVPGCRDAIEPGSTGLLVPVQDPVALADALELLIRDADLRQQLGTAGRMLAECEFDLNKVVQQHLEIYSKLERVFNAE